MLLEIKVARNFDEATLPHFFNKHVSKMVHSLKETSGKKAGRRGWKDKKYSSLVHWSSLYHANIGRSNSFCRAEITQNHFAKLAKGKYDWVRINMSIHGNCKYIWKKSIGQSGIYLGKHYQVYI